MITLQKASVGKRIIATIFDGILISIIAVGLIALFTIIFKTDVHFNNYKQAYEKYSTEYNVNLSYEELSALTEQEQSDFYNRSLEAEKAFSNDKTAMYAYNMFINLSLMSCTFSILLSVVLIEFVVPLFFGNGQTLGKKIFGIALMHKDYIKINNFQLFIRAVLGKFAIEIMIPIYIIMMICFNLIGVVSIAVLLIIAIIQLICLIATRTNSLLHDIMAGTITVDMASQRIFESREDLMEYTKKIHAQEANKPTY